MTFSLKQFKGEIPANEPHMLPQDNAQLAINCDFAQQALTPLAAGSLLATMLSNPVKGMYTEDGLTFYTWPIETQAFRSPILADPFSRIYYLQPSDGNLRVATKIGMAANGPSPGANVKAGVPRPTVAPVLSTVDLNSLPDFPNVTITVTAWWDYGGTRYAQYNPALTTVTALREYTFPAIAYPANPPAGVPQLGIEFKITDNNNANAVVAIATFKTGTNGRTNALPGGCEFGVSVDNTGLARIKLYWGAVAAAAYSYTLQNTWNEESASSPPAVISASYVQAVKVVVTTPDFTGYQPFLKHNIYRTYGAGTTYIQTNVTTIDAVTYQDATNKPNSLGIALQSVKWFPPIAGLQGMCSSSNGGWLAGFKDNVVYFSESNFPHAWPYSTVFTSNVRGILPMQGGLLVTCADGVYFCAGLSPAQMARNPDVIDLPQPGVAQRSMAHVDGGSIYASNDGLPIVSGAVGTMDASERIFTRDSWRQIYGSVLNDASLRFAYFDGGLVATSNTHPLGFVLRFDERIGNFTRTDLQIDCTFQVPLNDSLFYSIGANVYKYKAGAAQAYTWWSKDFVYRRPISMGAGYMRTSGPVTVQVYADGALFNTQTVSDGYFRIPPIKARRWSFKFTGSSTIFEVKVARTFSELQDVD